MRVSFLLPWVLSLMLAMVGTFPGAPVVAAAQDAAPATESAGPWEALLLDPAGARLLGHGLSDVGGLVLELGASVERFVLILVGPQGTLERFEGYVDAEGTLMVSTDESGAPTLQTLQALLERRGLALTVVRVRQDDASARRDETGGTPGGLPADDDAGDDGNGDGQDDGDQDGDVDDADGGADGEDRDGDADDGDADDGDDDGDGGTEDGGTDGADDDGDDDHSDDDGTDDDGTDDDGTDDDGTDDDEADDVDGDLETDADDD